MNIIITRRTGQGEGIAVTETIQMGPVLIQKPVYHDKIQSLEISLRTADGDGEVKIWLSPNDRLKLITALDGER